jgi:hypothetical protein
VSDDDRDPTLRVRRDLSEIRRLAGWLEDQALHHFADRLMPGGRALVELGPVARAEDVAERIEASEHWNAAHYGETSLRDLSHLDDQDDDVVALSSMLFWSDAWREETGSTPERRPTISGEAQWLASAIDWAWDNEAHWDDFCADVNDVRVRLENVLYAGVREERSQATCIEEACERKPRLVKVWGGDEESDSWKCPSCRTRYDKAAFARAKLRHMASRGAERFVKVQDARDVILEGGRPERTWRKWMSECRVLAYCDVVTHQAFCWWPDVRFLDLTTPRRRRHTDEERVA